MEDSYSVSWPGNDQYADYEDRALEAIDELAEEVYVLAFKSDQYVPRFKQKFEEKYNSNAVLATPHEAKEILEDLITIYLISKDMDWIVLFDHDANIHFSGEIKDQAKNAFEEQY